MDHDNNDFFIDQILEQGVIGGVKENGFGSSTIKIPKLVLGKVKGL